MKVRLEVTVDPEDPAKLALELASALSSSIESTAEAEAFEEQAVIEDGKADALVALAQRVRAYRSQPPVTRRRMDPMATYDLQVLDTETGSLRARADELRSLAQTARTKAAECHQQIPKLQERIGKAHEQRRKQSDGSP